MINPSPIIFYYTCMDVVIVDEASVENADLNNTAQEYATMDDVVVEHSLSARVN